MYFRRFLFVLMPALAALMSTSCINDHAQCPTTDDEQLYTLNLNIAAARLANTRAELGQNHSPEIGSREESFVNIAGKDYCVVILDGDGDDGKLLHKFGGDNDLEVRELERDGKLYYQLTGKFLPQSDAVRVMVLANWDALEGGAYNEISADDTPETTLKDLFGDKDIIFNYPVTSGVSFAPSDGSGTSKAAGIPMFGVTDKIQIYPPGTIASGDTGIFNPELDMELQMLRALAKIEIVDMVPDGESANIEKCVLTKYNTSGRFIPIVNEDDGVNKGWNELATQVTSPSIPDGVATSETPLQFIQTKKYVQPVGATADVERDCFVVYIPEMVLSDVAADDNPVIEVYLKGNDAPYTIYLGNYTDGKITEENGQMQLYKHLLRNHNYRFNVVGVGSAEFDFKVQTQWTDYESDEWTYNDAKIEFEPLDDNNLFSWVNVSQSSAGDTVYPRYEDIIEPYRTVIISQDGWLEGTFHLTEPAKGIWTLSLYSNDNTMSDRFRIDTGKEEFLNPDDESLGTKKIWTDGGASVSGKVGEEILFRIIPVGANNSSDYNVARLVMTCTTFDDRIMEVNIPFVVDNKTVDNMTQPILGESNNDYYYVKQYYTGFDESETDDL